MMKFCGLVCGSITHFRFSFNKVTSSCCIKSKAGVKLGCTLKGHTRQGEDLC